jgi:hypothetical protein
MIYSPDHNFLLLKNHKVGGTSLEVDLSMVLPDNAIVTPKTSNHPAWKLKVEKLYSGYNPRNYDGFYNHISYSEVAEKIDLSDVKSYVFVRHPYDAVLSNFFHRAYFIEVSAIWNKLNKKKQRHYVDLYFNDQLGWNWYRGSKEIYTSEDGIIQVTEILKYEDGIEPEINKILTKHSIKNIEIKAKEKAFRPDGIQFFDVFSEEDLKKIYDSWEWEFKNLGYKA